MKSLPTPFLASLIALFVHRGCHGVICPTCRCAKVRGRWFQDGWLPASGVHRVGLRARAGACGVAAAGAEFTPSLHPSNRLTPIASLPSDRERLRLTRNLLWNTARQGRTPSLPRPQSSPPAATPNLAQIRPVQPLHQLSQGGRSLTGKWCSRRSSKGLRPPWIAIGRKRANSRNLPAVHPGSLTNLVQFTKKSTITEVSIMAPIIAAAIHFIAVWAGERPDLLMGWHLPMVFGTRCSGS